ncbi:hypothetical protein ACRALDRAFT_1066837 [Sodiomyces alcalophilus JCM 7366]|uniref:uncharacterized protein n=1 Tax=Sodiomyces alcalophilus JCM 7366 TaxID=591952 RepID=UPI0039B536A7
MATPIKTSKKTICLEVPIFSPAAALQSQSLPIARIELNARGSYPAGGLTPRLQDVQCITSLTISSSPSPSPSSPAPTRPSIRVMIRPRVARDGERDYIYSDADFETMLSSVSTLVSDGGLDPSRGDGFVFGILRMAAGDGSPRARGRVVVDVARNRRLVDLAKRRGLSCTFHRAFDEILRDDGAWDETTVADAVDDLVACGFDAVLTSGGPGRAVDGIESLRVVVDKATKRGLDVLVAGGVRSGNVDDILSGLRGGGGRTGTAFDPEDGGMEWEAGESESMSGRVWMHSSCLRPGDGETVDEVEVEALLDRLKLT